MTVKTNGWEIVVIKYNADTNKYEFDLYSEYGKFDTLESENYTIDNQLSTIELLPSIYRITLNNGFEIYTRDYLKA